MSDRTNSANAVAARGTDAGERRRKEVQPVYVLRLTAVPGGVPPTIRLRAALKRFLRDYGLRCLEVSEERPTARPADEGAGVGPA